MKYFLLSTLIVSTFTHSFEMGISSSRTPPIATIYHTKEGPQIRESGVLYLLGQYISKHTGEKTTFKVIDRNTIDNALLKNQVMSVCYTTPKWLSLSKGSVVFSKAFMTNNEFLVSKKPIPLIKTPKDLNGLNIGLITGHHYPLLQSRIDKGLIHTEYYQSEINAFISLFRQNTLDVIMFKEVGFKHLMQSMPQIVGKSKITIHPLSFGELQVSCALSLDNQHYLVDLNNAIDEFISDQSL